MKNWIPFLLAGHSLFGAYLDPSYEGIHPSWKAMVNVEERLAIVDKYLPENPTVFEAGAFDGQESLKMSKFWPSGKIISFEPNPSRFDDYKKTTKGCTNTFGYNLAVNTYKGLATFYLCWGYGGNNPVFEGASSLLEPTIAKRKDYEGPLIDVSCVILDDWCKENGVEKVDFMWLDLEGFELQLLKSSPDILKTVRVIYTETNLKLLREEMTQFPELSEFLVQNGFQMIAHWYAEGYQGDAIFVRI